MSPELAEALTKWITVASVIFGVLSGLSVGATFWCQTVTSAASDKKIADAERKALEADLKAERLKNAVIWRSVTDEQTKKLSLLLTTKPNKIIIYFPGNDPEAQNYAESLGVALKSLAIPCYFVPFFENLNSDPDLLIYTDDINNQINWHEAISSANISNKMLHEMLFFSITRTGENTTFSNGDLVLYVTSRKPPKI